MIEELTIPKFEKRHGKTETSARTSPAIYEVLLFGRTPEYEENIEVYCDIRLKVSKAYSEELADNNVGVLSNHLMRHLQLQ